MCTRKKFLMSKLNVLVICSAPAPLIDASLLREHLITSNNIKDIIDRLSLISNDKLESLVKESLNDSWILDLTFKELLVKNILKFIKLTRDTTNHYMQADVWERIVLFFKSLGIGLDCNWQSLDPNYLATDEKHGIFQGKFGLGTEFLPEGLKSQKYDIIIDAGCMLGACGPYNFLDDTGLQQIQDTLTTENGWGMYIKLGRLGLVLTDHLMYCGDKPKKINDLTPEEMIKFFPKGLVYTNITVKQLPAIIKLPKGKFLSN